MKQERLRILTEILRLVNRPCGFRAVVIGLIFPEMDGILTKLSELSSDIENNP